MSSQEPPGAPSPQTGEEQNKSSDVARSTLAAVALESQVSQPQTQSSIVVVTEATSTTVPTDNEPSIQAEAASSAQGESDTRKRKKKSRSNQPPVTPSEPAVQTTGDGNPVAGSSQLPNAQTAPPMPDYIASYTTTNANNDNVAMSERRRGKLPVAAAPVESEQTQYGTATSQPQESSLTYRGDDFTPQGRFSRGQSSRASSRSGTSRQGRSQFGATRYGPSTSGPSQFRATGESSFRSRPSGRFHRSEYGTTRGSPSKRTYPNLFPWQKGSSQIDTTHVDSARPGPSSETQSPLADANEARLKRKKKEADDREYVAGQQIGDGYIAVRPGTIQHGVKQLDAARLAMQSQFNSLKKIVSSITDELVRERRISRSLLQTVIERSAQAEGADVTAFFEEGRHLSPNLTPLLQQLNDIVRRDPFPVIDRSIDQNPQRGPPAHQSTQATRPLSPELGDLIDVLAEPTFLDTRNPEFANAHAQGGQQENQPTMHEDDQNKWKDMDEKKDDGKGPDAGDDKIQW